MRMLMAAGAGAEAAALRHWHRRHWQPQQVARRLGAQNTGAECLQITSRCSSEVEPKRHMQLKRAAHAVPAPRSERPSGTLIAAHLSKRGNMRST